MTRPLTASGAERELSNVERGELADRLERRLAATPCPGGFPREFAQLRDVVGDVVRVLRGQRPGFDMPAPSARYFWLPEPITDPATGGTIDAWSEVRDGSLYVYFRDEVGLLHELAEAWWWRERSFDDVWQRHVLATLTERAVSALTDHPRCWLTPRALADHAAHRRHAAATGQHEATKRPFGPGTGAEVFTGHPRAGQLVTLYENQYARLDSWASQPEHPAGVEPLTERGRPARTEQPHAEGVEPAAQGDATVGKPRGLPASVRQLITRMVPPGVATMLALVGVADVVATPAGPAAALTSASALLAGLTWLITSEIGAPIGEAARARAVRARWPAGWALRMTAQLADWMRTTPAGRRGSRAVLWTAIAVGASAAVGTLLAASSVGGVLAVSAPWPGPASDEKLSDAELIATVRLNAASAAAAYRQLYERHRGAADRLARSLSTGHGVDADDLVAEAFTKVLGALRNGAGPDEHFVAYLYTAIRNEFVDRARQACRFTTLDEIPDLPDPVADVEGQALDADERQRDAPLVRRAFAQLPERLRRALTLTEIERLPPAAASRLMELSPNAFAALAYRARKRLREYFEELRLADEQQPGPIE